MFFEKIPWYFFGNKLKTFSLLLYILKLKHSLIRVKLSFIGPHLFICASQHINTTKEDYSISLSINHSDLANLSYKIP